MKIYKVEQGSDEWLNIRLGKFTGSNFHVFLGNSQKKETEIYKKVSERITKTRADSDIFSNHHIKRGKELEDEARDLYEIITGTEVLNVGFIELDETVGCSPDGLIGENGIIEIKCKDNHTHLKQILRDKIEHAHFTQVQFNLYVCNKQWCDYICYNQNFVDLYIKRITRDEETIQQIIDCINDCNIKIDKIMKELNYGKQRG